MKKSLPPFVACLAALFKKDLLYREGTSIFEKVELPEGNITLEAWVEVDGTKHGFRHITIDNTGIN